MLARTFKTYRQLGIKKKEYDALIKTMQMLERGEAVLLKAPHIDFEGTDRTPQINPKGFSMSFAACGLLDRKSHHGCGTVACIGGWTAYHMGARTIDEMERYVCTSHHLEALFFPDGLFSTVGYSAITPSQAAQAIGNYLTTGEPHWDDVLGLR